MGMETVDIEASRRGISIYSIQKAAGNSAARSHEDGTDIESGY